MAATKPAPWLLADVGGSNVRFALAQPGALAPLQLDTVYAYRVADFPSLQDAARAYLAVVATRPVSAIIAVAGPVRGDQVQLTNHSWLISAPELQAALGLNSVRLVNDFAAVGMGLPLLGPGDVQWLGAGERERGSGPARQAFCVLGPGTGLGVSALTLRDGVATGLETEGGHASYAPTTEEEIAILRQLMARFGRVSHERLLCGSGLANLYQALCAVQGSAVRDLPPDEITARARTEADPQCVHAARLFCAILASVAGDFALAYGAWDGVYLAGGVLGALSPWLQEATFRARFNDKGRFAAAMAKIPVGLIIHPQPGLLGAAGFAVAASGRPLVRMST